MLAAKTSSLKAGGHVLDFDEIWYRSNPWEFAVTPLTGCDITASFIIHRSLW
jgi:hypothetical protein